MKTVAMGLVGGLVIGGAVGYGAAVMAGKARRPGGTTSTSTTATTATTGITGTTTVDSGEPVPLFELAGKTYTDADLPADVRSQLFEGQTEAFGRQEQVLTSYALRLHLAAEKGKSVEAGKLPPLEDLLNAPTPSDEDVKKIYEENKARLPPNTSFDQIKPEIVKYLRNQKLSETLQTQLTQFKSQGAFKVLAAAPMAPVVEMDLKPYASQGPATATHTIVEVADYVCPHCQGVQPEVEAAIKELGDKVRFVAVNFTLNPKGLSNSLALGGYCARQQSDESFWKYHEAAFRTARTKGWKSSDPESSEAVSEVAKTAGIDAAKVESCLKSDDAKKAVAAAQEAMHSYGVTSTPTFFVNGRQLSIQGKPLKDALVGSIGAASH
jgi:protein-disulfide isomerase